LPQITEPLDGSKVLGVLKRLKKKLWDPRSSLEWLAYTAGWNPKQLPKELNDIDPYLLTGHVSELKDILKGVEHSQVGKYATQTFVEIASTNFKHLDGYLDAVKEYAQYLDGVLKMFDLGDNTISRDWESIKDIIAGEFIGKLAQSFGGEGVGDLSESSKRWERYLIVLDLYMDELRDVLEDGDIGMCQEEVVERFMNGAWEEPKKLCGYIHTIKAYINDSKRKKDKLSFSLLLIDESISPLRYFLAEGFARFAWKGPDKLWNYIGVINLCQKAECLSYINPPSIRKYEEYFNLIDFLGEYLEDLKNVLKDVESNILRREIVKGFIKIAKEEPKKLGDYTPTIRDNINELEDALEKTKSVITKEKIAKGFVELARRNPNELGSYTLSLHLNLERLEDALETMEDEDCRDEFFNRFINGDWKKEKMWTSCIYAIRSHPNFLNNVSEIIEDENAKQLITREFFDVAYLGPKKINNYISAVEQNIKEFAEILREIEDEEVKNKIIQRFIEIAKEEPEKLESYINDLWNGYIYNKWIIKSIKQQHPDPTEVRHKIPKKYVNLPRRP